MSSSFAAEYPARCESPPSAFFTALQRGTRFNPRPVILSVPINLLIEDDLTNQEVGVQVIPTSIRSIRFSDCAEYDYEFEGWILGDYEGRIYIKGTFSMGSSEPQELTIRRTDPRQA